MTRTQINFRLDDELLAKIRAKCDKSGVSLTDYLTDAARSALGRKSMDSTSYPDTEALSGIIERIDNVEKRLDNRIADAAVVGLEQQVEELLGESNA